MAKLKLDPTKTVLTITVGFLIVYLVTSQYWAIIVSLIVGVIGVFSNYLSEKINFIWMKLTWLLSLIIPNILLGTIYYFFLFPISILSKIFGSKDPLMLKDQEESTFRTTNKKFDVESFEKPW